MVCWSRLTSTMRSISWKYSRRIEPALALGGDEVVDARAEILQDEILLGRRLAVVDLLRPLLERELDAERLVDGKGDIEEVEAVDPEIVDRVALRLDGLTLDIARFGNDAGNGVEGG